MKDIDTKLQEFIKSLDDYEQRIQLITPQKPSDIDLYMDIAAEKLKLMTDDECGTAAVKLTQYNIYLQREINRQVAIKNWAMANINAFIAESWDQYDKYIKVDIRQYLIEKENSAAARLNKIYITASTRVDSLSYITGRIDAQSQALLALQQTKRNRK
jgi:hypothetical protein